MLINDFYTCSDIVQGDTEYSCLISFNAEHAIFGGHFPGQPIVPGVCMMEIVKELLQQLVSKPLMLHQAGNVKFLGLITPDVTPVIHINWSETPEGYTVKASFKSGTSVLFKIDGKYEAA
jgi:3-hydroxyacyl-[acyl-carrier-protein] dehydratase